MANLPDNLDFTDKDFDSLNERIDNLIQSAFPDWSDRNISNFGNILKELIAFVGDVLLFYQDNQAKEAFIPTAQLRRSLLALGKLIGYTPEGATAATVELTYTLAAVPVGDVVIQAGDTFRTLEVSDPVVFQALADATIVGGANPPQIIFTAEHSSNSTEVFQSTELPNQAFQLSGTPFLDGSLTATADNGDYTVVADFLDSTSTDRHMTVVVDENDRAIVRFGNAINGEVPTGQINFGYKTGGGSAGNVNPGTVARVDKSYSDSFGNPVQSSVTNQASASGGSDRESVASIRVAAPRSLRTLNRTVAREDYEINALRVPGVARALMLTSNERQFVGENAGELYIVPEGGGTPTQALKDAVLTMVTETYPNTLTFVVGVFDAVYLSVDITASVVLADNVGAATVDASIRANLADFFDLDGDDGAPNPDIDFGYYLKDALAFSDIYNVIRDTTGVRKMSDAPDALRINGASEDLDVDTREFPRLGTVTLLNAVTGAPLV